MKQTPAEIVAGYEKPDPWGYQTNPADQVRKDIILETAKRYGPYKRAIDLCCGEGWITKDLPAYEISGWELSVEARRRFPINVLDVDPRGKYDLIVLTGALYDHYDWEKFVHLINEHSSNIILLCNIKDWEVPDAVKKIDAVQIFEAEFEYNRHEKESYVQKLRVFKV